MRELISGGDGPHTGRAGVSSWSDLPLDERSVVPPWSDLPLNRIQYIPLSIFAYSSNIVIANFVAMGSTFEEGTLKAVKFFLSSSSLNDRAPEMKLTCSTFQPCRYIVLARADLRDKYCVSATCLVLTIYQGSLSSFLGGID